MGRRGVRILVVLAVVLAGLFVAADRVAVSYAERAAADHIRAQRHLRDEPRVSIKGFPFLTQFLARQLDHVTLSVTGITTEVMADGGHGLRLKRFGCDAYDVQLLGDWRGVVVGHGSCRALLSYAELSAIAPHGWTVAWGGRSGSGTPQVKVGVVERVPVPLPKRIRLRVPHEVTLRHTFTTRLRLRGGHLVAPLDLSSLPGAGLLPKLPSSVDFFERLAGLPGGIRLKAVRPAPQGVEVTFDGDDVTFTH